MRDCRKASGGEDLEALRAGDNLVDGQMILVRAWVSVQGNS